MSRRAGRRSRAGPDAASPRGGVSPLGRRPPGSPRPDGPGPDRRSAPRRRSPSDRPLSSRRPPAAPRPAGPEPSRRHGSRPAAGRPALSSLRGGRRSPPLFVPSRSAPFRRSRGRPSRFPSICDAPRRATPPQVRAWDPAWSRPRALRASRGRRRASAPRRDLRSASSGSSSGLRSEGRAGTAAAYPATAPPQPGHTGEPRSEGPVDASEPPARGRGFAQARSGGDLLSQGISPQVPSALEGLTSVFGMGTGVTPPPSPPKPCCQRRRPAGRSASRTPQRARTSFVDPSPRPISTGRLNMLPCVHLRPINVIVYHGPYLVDPVGNLILERASHLDAFSAYPFRRSPTSHALGRTTGTRELRPSRSSRTRDSLPQVSSGCRG